MALETIISEVYLDVYDHDTTPSTIKTIALDSQTRYVHAFLQKNGLEVYNPDLSATVTLTAIRPDNVGAESTGSVVELVPATEDSERIDYDEEDNPVTVIIPGTPAVYGLEAEITQAMIAIPGVVRFQFKMEVVGEIIRTEIFNANNGIALDGQTTDWADEYQGYNLDELVEEIANLDEQVEEIANLKEELNAELRRTYTSPYTPTYNVISGGIAVSGGDYNNHADRARTQYIPITAGETYYVHLNTTDYTIQRAWIYTSNASSGAVKELRLVDGQTFVFTADDNINYVRMAFVNSADSSTTITEENRTAIKSALGIYTNTALETLENHDVCMSGLLDYPTISWKAFPQTTNDNYVLSWRGGYWGNSNNAVNSITDGAIRFWTWIGKQREAIGTNYVEFIPPTVGYIVLKEYETKSTTELLARYDITEPTVIRLHDTHIYRISVYGLGDDLSPYLTEEFIQSIGIKPIYAVKYATKLPRGGEFIRFNVRVNNAWPHGTYTDVNDHESGEEHDHLCILTLPESYTASGKKTPLIMYCHGASCGITATKWYGNSTGEGDGADFLAMIRRFTAKGYAVFDVDNTRHVSSGFNDWGSLPLMSAYIKAWKYIKENYNVSDKLFILSASMGTPAALNMMKWHKSDVLASLILAPRPFGAKGRWDGEVTDARIKEFLVAWGFEPDSILEDETFVVPSRDSVFTADVDAKLRGFYHYENIVTIDGTDYVFEKYPPTKVMVGLGDTDFLSEVRRFFSALGNFGNYINYRELASQTHGQTCTLNHGDLRDEALAWFERFRYDEPDEDEEA